MKKVNSKTILEIIIIILFGVIITASFIYRNYDNRRKEIEESKKIRDVTDESRYFTVINCINKYLTYASNKDTASLYLVFDKDYEKENYISERRTLEYAPNLDDSYIYSYEATSMKYQRVSKSIYRYYVKGNIIRESINEKETLYEYDVTVILNHSKTIFSIIPGVKYEN